MLSVERLCQDLSNSYLILSDTSDLLIVFKEQQVKTNRWDIIKTVIVFSDWDITKHIYLWHYTGLARNAVSFLWQNCRDTFIVSPIFWSNNDLTLVPAVIVIKNDTTFSTKHN